MVNEINTEQMNTFHRSLLRLAGVADGMVAHHHQKLNNSASAKDTEQDSKPGGDGNKHLNKKGHGKHRRKKRNTKINENKTT